MDARPAGHPQGLLRPGDGARGLVPPDEEGRLHANLGHIRALAAIVTYGRDRPILWWFGDPPRKMFTRYMKWFIAKGARTRYLALYNLHKPSAERIERFMRRIDREMAGFGV